MDDTPTACDPPYRIAPPMSYDRLCTEIVAQTDLVRSRIRGADMTTPVPSCPGWNVGQLLRHLGGAHRAAEASVRDRAEPAPSDESWRDLSGYTDEDPAVLDWWLAEGAAGLAEALRAAGPDARMPNAPDWAPATTIFPARRMAHETLIHRADAELALGVGVTADPDLAIDAVDEWMTLGALPVMFEIDPARRALLGPGRTLHFHPTDTGTGSRAEWLVDLTGDAIAWRRGHGTVAVTVRGRLTDLLLVIYRRLPADHNGLDVVGDKQLLGFWLDRVSFG